MRLHFFSIRVIHNGLITKRSMFSYIGNCILDTYLQWKQGTCRPTCTCTWRQSTWYISVNYLRRKCLECVKADKQSAESTALNQNKENRTKSNWKSIASKSGMPLLWRTRTYARADGRTTRKHNFTGPICWTGGCIKQKPIHFRRNVAKVSLQEGRECGGKKSLSMVKIHYHFIVIDAQCCW